MVIQKVDTMLIAFFALFVISYLNTATSLQCYHCESNSTGSCWTSPQSGGLTECGEEGSTQSPSTTTMFPGTTSTMTSSSNPTITPTPEGSSSPSTVSTQPSSSNPTTTSAPVVTSAPTTASTQPSSSNPTTTSAPVVTSAPTTASTLSSSSNPTTTSAPVVTPAPTTASTQPSSSDLTTSPTSQVTNVATRSSTGAPSTIQTTISPAETQQAQSSPVTTPDPSANAEVRVLLKNGMNSRLRRDIIARADDNTYQCATIIYKDGDTDMVKRTCIVRTSTPCAEDKILLNATVCEVCDDDGCNTSSKISFGLISMFIPFAMTYYILSQT